MCDPHPKRIMKKNTRPQSSSQPRLFRLSVSIRYPFPGSASDAVGDAVRSFADPERIHDLPCPGVDHRNAVVVDVADQRQAAVIADDHAVESRRSQWTPQEMSLRAAVSCVTSYFRTLNRLRSQP